MTTVVLVEGASDAAVLRVLGAPADLPVLPTGGATGAARTLAALGDRPERVLALCDEGEAPHVRRALTGPGDRLLVCRRDLEDELLRALGPERAVAVLAATGDLRAFRVLQQQPDHRGEAVHAQLHRFIAAGSGRKARIDAALAAALPRDEVPPPLRTLLTLMSERACRPRTA